MIKYQILNKLRQGHKCRYIGKTNSELGFIYGREYFIVDRKPKIIAFSTNKHKRTIDFGLNDSGDWFLENWEVINQEHILELPDVDFESEKFYLFFEMIELNSQIKE